MHAGNPWTSWIYKALIPIQFGLGADTGQQEGGGGDSPTSDLRLFVNVLSLSLI